MQCKEKLGIIFNWKNSSLF